VEKGIIKPETIPEYVDNWKIQEYEGEVDIWLSSNDPYTGGWNAVALEILEGTNINDLSRSINQILR
jgi:hypothetical protein